MTDFKLWNSSTVNPAYLSANRDDFLQLRPAYITLCDMVFPSFLYTIRVLHHRITSTAIEDHVFLYIT